MASTWSPCLPTLLRPSPKSDHALSCSPAALWPTEAYKGRPCPRLPLAHGPADLPSVPGQAWPDLGAFTPGLRQHLTDRALSRGGSALMSPPRGALPDHGAKDSPPLLGGLFPTCWLPSAQVTAACLFTVGLPAQTQAPRDRGFRAALPLSPGSKTESDPRLSLNHSMARTQERGRPRRARGGRGGRPTSMQPQKLPGEPRGLDRRHCRGSGLRVVCCGHRVLTFLSSSKAVI